MAWQQTAFTIPTILTSLIAFASAFYVLQRCHTSSSKTGALLLLAQAFWALAGALELSGADLPTKIFWNKAQYVGIIAVPTAWLIYTLQYTGRKKWLTRRALALISVVPLVFLLLVFSSESHNLMWTDVRLDTTGPFAVLDKNMELGFQMLIAYLYATILLGAWLLGRTLSHSSQVYPWQARVLISAVITPWVVNAMVQAYNWVAFPNLDLTPVSLVLFHTTNLEFSTPCRAEN